MSISIKILMVVIAIEHFWFLVLEMFLWTKPKGLKTFKMTQEVANSSAVLAANQGLYNGFMASGILMGMALENREFSSFFLICIIIAGAYGGATVNKRIFFLQSLPALVCLVLLLMS